MKNYVSLFIIYTSLFLACRNDGDKSTAVNESIQPMAIGKVNTDSTALPKITHVKSPRILPVFKTEVKKNPFADGLGRQLITGFGADKGFSFEIPQNLFFDKLGMLWILTNKGFAKYDGVNTTAYNMFQALPTDYNSCMAQDNAGNYWFGSLNNGIFKYDGYRFTQFDTANGLLSNKIFDIVIDKSDNLLIATAKGISKFDGNKFSDYSTQIGLLGENIRCLMIDHDNNIWISHSRGLLSVYDGKTLKAFSKKDGLTLSYIPKIFQDASNNIWILSGNGVNKYDGQQFVTYDTADGLPSNRVIDAVFDAAGNIWFATQKGLSKYDGNTFTNYSTEHGLKSNFIINLAIDAAGNIWGISMAEIFKISGSFLTTYTTEEGMADSDFGFLELVPDNSGNIWFATEDGIGKYDGYLFTNYQPLEGKMSISNLIVDKDDNIWFSLSTKGYCKFDGKQFTLYPFEDWDNTISSVKGLQDSKGNFWIQDEGVLKFDGKSFSRFTTAQGLVSNKTWGATITEDNAENIWINTQGGLSKYDGKQFVNYTTEDGLPSDNVQCIAKDEQGWLWIGTDAGLSIYDGNAFTNYKKREGLAEENIERILADTINRRIWLVTNAGLSAINSDSMRVATAGKKLPIEHFTYQTGYPLFAGLFFNAQIDKNGIIWLSKANGELLRFDYSLLRKTTSAKIDIHNIKLDNENIIWYLLQASVSGKNKYDSQAIRNETYLRFQDSLSSTASKEMIAGFKGVKFDSISPGDPIPQNLSIPFNHNNISFQFSAIAPAYGDKIRYQYMLKGYDKNWSDLGYITKADFNNIGEGHYIFLVRALNPNGQWSETSYSFKVLPPWWRTWWAYASYLLLFISGIYLFIRWRTKALQKDKLILEHKVSVRTNELKESLENLKSTQAQLIQSEKMASLGELTAGIAHEIQNPLNFVNNFSEVSQELVQELKDELEKGDIVEAQAISVDIIQNLSKITYHGKRASSIVKGMLEHSRKSSGIKEPTDINVLADEYLRLAYHGLRAKDRSFNVAFQTEFDPNLPKVNVIPQDIGRVLLNLINNAFQAVNERKNLIDSARQPSTTYLTDLPYEPRVLVSTKRVGSTSGVGGELGKGEFIQITVSDNGPGIPDSIKDKIFQPFFTTKPTGQGTGLGLSLAYDIVKAHGGELSVETKEGEGSEFLIALPL